MLLARCVQLTLHFMIRIYLHIILALVINTLHAQSFDYEYIDQSVDDNFRAVFFVNENVGYLGSYWGSIIKTTDSGYTWDSTNLINDAPIYEIQFIDEFLGFAAGGSPNCIPNPCTPPGSVIFRTNDGGISWTKTTLGINQFNTLHFINADTGFVAGAGSFLYKTTDSGSTWNAINLNNFYNIIEIQFVNNVGYCCAANGKILKSTDLGFNWNVLSTGVNWHILSIDFIDEYTGYAVGHEGVLKTIDGGTTWQVLPLDVFLTSISALSSDHIVASGIGQTVNTYLHGGIYESLDGGLTWYIEDSLSLHNQTQTFFPTPNLGFAVALDSKILRLSKSETSTFINVKENQIDCNVLPNPVNSTFLVNCTLFDKITLMDKTGKEVLKQSITGDKIDVSFLPSGLYFYELSKDIKTTRGKLLKK